MPPAQADAPSAKTRIRRVTLPGHERYTLGMPKAAAFTIVVGFGACSAVVVSAEKEASDG
jgi:hypothetical protein